ncbi:MAG TPA: holo-ACP synthase [Chroococcales cyanobacterium]
MHSHSAFKIGTDICSVERITRTFDKFGMRFARRILTQSEQNYVFGRKHQKMHSLAARFAAKEAASKALGVGWNGIGWKEIEVTRKPSGEPGLLLHGRAASLAEKLGLEHFEVTLSHEREYAVAFVLAYSGKS